MRKISKFLSILLVLTLIIPGFTFAQEGSNIQSRQMELSERAYRNLQDESLINEKLIDSSMKTRESFKDEDEVRIIVELSSDPSIVYATERGMAYEAVSNTQIEKLERNLEVEQEAVKATIAKNSIDMEYINSFKTVFNGFSGIVRFADIARIEKLQNVKNVYIATEYNRPEITPDMGSSHDMIGSYDVWANDKFKGEGTVIAVLDTGIDFRHKDMKLSEETDPKLTKAIVESTEGLAGKFFTEKVPYGYNYYDLNNEVLDLGPEASMHGMHVAGTVGANGVIKGVAPEAQLLAMKVFSNDPIYSTTFGDLYIIAIEDSVKLGADVINMSLGSTASFYVAGNPEEVALTNAVNNGVVCSISAGNSNRFGSGYDNPWKQNPDTGVVGSPSLNTDTMSVASIENLGLTVNKVSYKDGQETKDIPMMMSGDLDFKHITGEIEFVECGLGMPENFVGKDLEGKIALIVRGEIGFGVKIENAQAAGAIGVIIYNSQPNGDALMGMGYGDSTVTVPTGFIGYSFGIELKELAEKMISFPSEMMSTPNANGGLMSEFTSWGVTPSLELKPEITAPGGMIYSTLNDDQYGFMSGTSMAAPHLAGGAALVMQYIKQHEIYKGYSLEEQARLAKVLLMNTAVPVIDEEDALVSPRRQGAGLMNLSAAVNTDVRVVNVATNEAKVELKDFMKTSFTMNLKAINDSKNEMTYLVDVSVLADNILPVEWEGYTYEYITNARYLDADVEVVGGNEIVIPAESSLEFTINVDFKNAKEIYKNMFVEGFVVLKDKADTASDLVVPYVGFYGEWDEPAIIEPLRFIDEEKSFYGAAGIVDLGFRKYMGLEDDGQLYINPGTRSGAKNGTEGFKPYLTFLRNAEDVSYNILSEEGKILRTLLKQTYVRKNYHDGKSPKASVVEMAAWSGIVRNKVVPDGKYFYEITANIHYAGAKTQSKKIPVTVDTTGPEMSNVKYDAETGKLLLTVKDAGIGLDYLAIFVNDELLVDHFIDVEYDNDGNAIEEYEVDISEYLVELGENIIEIVSFDLLGNDGYELITQTIDNSNAYIFLISPDLLVAYNEAPVLSNPSTIDELPINSIIVGDKAYDQEYAATNVMAQLHILFTNYMGQPIFVKTSEKEAMDLRGNIVSLYDFPEILRYYDVEGIITDRYTIVEEEEMLEGVGVKFQGFIANFEALDKVLVDGEEIDFTYEDDIDSAGYKGPGYTFETVIRMEDGYKNTKITAISKTGAESSIVRRYWVDNTAPILELEVLERDPSSNKATIKVTMKDNFGFIALYMFDNYEFKYDETYDRLDTDPANQTITIEVELEEGDNTFEFSLYDIVDNSAVKEITITRTAE